jgi:histidine ammonia-lyase
MPSEVALQIGPDQLIDLEAFADVVDGHRLVEVEPATLALLDRGFEAARARAAKDRTYGVGTGFGPMVRVDIPPGEVEALQYNLVRSHAMGMGRPYSPRLSRAILLARLQNLTRGRSGVRGELPALCAGLLNARIAPFIPRKGGVGASGDLVQLAHLGMLLIGEGRCWAGGAQAEAASAISGAGLSPLRLQFRDGLSIVNGTSAMTGQGACAVMAMHGLVETLLGMSALMAEITGLDPAAYSAALNEAKLHPGQREAAARLRAALNGGQRLGAHKSEGGGHDRPMQEHYSIRCAPQIIGPMLEGLALAERIVVAELNSVNDNPVFDPETGEALHGGNFHGEYVAYAMDALKISAVKGSMLLERQLNFLLNDAVNNILPPFVNLGRIGIELGLQGAQFTAVSTAAENQTLAYPMSLHSIPSNKDNQDIVSMGSNAAWLALQTLDNAFDIAAIHALAVSQAVEALGILDQLSPASRARLQAWRAIVPVFRKDTINAGMLAALADHLRGGASEFV